MYVDTSNYKSGNKTHQRFLLRESYRENGKVKKRTIASLCHLTIEEIEAVKLALKHKKNLKLVTSINDSQILQGKSYGAILALQKISKELGITSSLGTSEEAKIALWQIIGRVLFQGSRLSLIRTLEFYAAEDILSLPKELTAKKLYNNLSWIAKHQLEIEKKLQQYHPIESNLYLYDVTSSYFEGEKNELAEYGYNRDKKKGKKQIVIGMLTNAEGYPISVRVFKGNSSDPTTIPTQVQLLQKEFKVKKITIVGDRAMLTKNQIEELPEGFSYITAIKKEQIKKLIKEDLIQLTLFDEDLQEVEINGVRHICRCNPVRKEEMSQSRKSKIERLENKISAKNEYLESHKKAKEEVAINYLNEYAKKLKIDKFVELTSNNRIITATIDTEAIKKESELDGCYIITTDITKGEATKDTIHSRYKDLALVEHAFRTMKQTHLHVRPVYLRKEDRTKAHVFITMLGYMIEKKLSEYWGNIDLTVQEALNALNTLTTNLLDIAEVKINRVVKPTGLCQKLLNCLNVKIPKTIGGVPTNKKVA